MVSPGQKEILRVLPFFGSVASLLEDFIEETMTFFGGGGSVAGDIFTVSGRGEADAFDDREDTEAVEGVDFPFTGTICPFPFTGVSVGFGWEGVSGF